MSDIAKQLEAATQHIAETEAYADRVVDLARTAAEMLGAFIDPDSPSPDPNVVAKHLIAMHRLMDGGTAHLPVIDT